MLEGSPLSYATAQALTDATSTAVATAVASVSDRGRERLQRQGLLAGMGGAGGREINERERDVAADL